MSITCIFFEQSLVTEKNSVDVFLYSVKEYSFHLNKMQSPISLMVSKYLIYNYTFITLVYT